MSKIDTASWKEFRIGDLFESANGDVDIQKSDIDGKGEYVVSSGVDNTGLIGRTSRTAKIFSKNTITVDMFGNVFYRPYEYKMVTHARIFSLSLIGHDMDEKTGLFLQTLIAKNTVNYSYSDMCSFKKLSDKTIILPATESEEIDWNYMQERIKELEQERIKELEQERIKELELYLIATGLNDYELTEDEWIALNRLDVKFSDFKIEDIFDLYKGQRLTKNDQLPGKTPFVGATDSNNGVTGYIGQEPIFEGNAITVSYNGSVGNVFYQDEPFWASDDINVLYLKNHQLDRIIFEYLASALKMAGAQFSYSFKWNLERMRSTAIRLPVDKNGNIDWEYIYIYMRAIEKKVIKDVVMWKDRELKILKGIAT